MLDRILTEQRNPSSANIDSLPTSHMLTLINKADQSVADAVGVEIPQITIAVDAIVERLRGSGRLFYIGAGTSGRLAVLDAAECPPTFSVPPDLVQGIMAGGDAAQSRATEASEDVPEKGKEDLMQRGFTGFDVLVGIAASGRTPYVMGAVAVARKLGALTVGICCTAGSELSCAVDIPIVPLTGPEIIAGSTRMKAGTATKLVLNMISTGVMIRLGHVYGNLMVNVQPKNSKLEDRAKRIIAEAAEVSYEEAGRLLSAAGSVKTAIIMKRLNVGKAAAEIVIGKAGGRIREALERRKA